MKMMRRWLLLLLLAALAPAQAETVYVNDVLRVSVRAQPGSGGATVAVLSSGTEMEVLERQPGYLRIRAGGTEGWVSEGFITTEIPPRQRLAQLEKAHAQAQAELERLRAASGTGGDQAAALAAQFEALQAENAQLKTTNATITAQLQATDNNLLWAYFGGGLLAAFLLGRFVGVRRYRQQLAQRFNGLQI